MTITAERLRELLHYDPDTGIFVWRVQRTCKAMVGTVAGATDKEGAYRKISVDGDRYSSHRLAWLYVYGEMPTGGIDHINCDGTDNRIANLRLATPQQNAWNSRRGKSNVSGFKGVHFNSRSGKYASSFRGGGQRRHLGYFDTAEQAAEAYREAIAEAHGEFARME
jgi:hypothetical protein